MSIVLTATALSPNAATSLRVCHTLAPFKVARLSTASFAPRRQAKCSARPQVHSTSTAVKELAPQTAQPPASSPWDSPKWQQCKWTVYRGVAYDLTSFVEKHPAGSWLINLAIGRDCTALFESSHLRPLVASQQLKRLPVLQDFPVELVPSSPYPNDSNLYNSIRERVRREVFKGQDAKGAHRTGSEGAALTVLAYAAVSCGAYLASPGIATGFLLGMAGAWIGLTIQHCGNHGAMSTKPIVNTLLGMTDDLIGGSSLMWRYHHQVSHHIHCNDLELDEDVFSAFPFLRFDARLPRKWFHRYQHVYMWATFPLLQLAFQAGDWQGLIENQTKGTTLHGASAWEKASVVLGKLVHYSIILALPALVHGWSAAAIGSATYMATQGIVLAATFAVSHNVESTKPAAAGSVTTSNLMSPVAERDWAVQQVLTSANWGGTIGNFFTGGLNLQIEHHLFPAISFVHYPAIAKIVRDECEKRGVPYTHYNSLPTIVGRFCRYMQQAGAADQMLMQDGSMLTATNMPRL